MEAGYLRLREVVVKRVAVVKFGVNSGGSSGTCCCGIEVRTDAMTLLNMIIAGFRES